MDSSQVGRAGELALMLHALVESDGELELFQPLVDDDHVDLVASLRGGLPVAAVQVKTAPAVDRNGLVEARAEYVAGTVRSDPAFIYAVLLLDGASIACAWLVPSPSFNRLVYRTSSAARDVLEFRASPTHDDDFAGFRTAPGGLGPALLALVRGLGPRLDLVPAGGLCAQCVHRRDVRGARSSFVMCALSSADPHFPRYPRLPVLRCRGFEKRDA